MTTSTEALSPALSLEERLRAALANLWSMRDEFFAFYREREEEVVGMFVALLSGKPMLIIGPPGTAKSLMLENLCRNTVGARFHYQLLTKYVTDKDLFVSRVTVRERQVGDEKTIEFHNDPTGRLGDCHLAFLDEVFLCSHTALTALLSLLANGTFSVNAGDVLRSPVLLIVGASNRLPGPEDGYLLHFLDRFLLRYRVDYLADPRNFVSLLADEKPMPGATIQLHEIELLQKCVRRVQVPKPVLLALSEVRTRLQAKNVRPSDRRWHECLKLLKAHALFRGRTHAVLEDITILQHSLWTLESEIKVVREAVLATSNAEQAKAALLYDEAQQAWEVVKDKDGADPSHLTELTAAEGRLRGILGELEQLTQNDARIRTYGNRVRVWLKAVKRLEGVDDALIDDEEPSGEPIDLTRP